MSSNSAHPATSRYLLQQSTLRQCWQAGFPQKSFYIAATSFGAGLNFLAAWRLWEQSAPPGKQMHFVAVDNQALPRSALEQALALWPELADCSQALLAVYPQRPTVGFHQFVFAQRRVTLTLIVAEAATGLKQLLVSDHPLHRKPFHPGMDAWLLDDVSPASDSSMHQPQLFDVIAALSRQHSRLATSTATASTKRELRRVGFRVEEASAHGTPGNTLVATFTAVTKPEAANFNPSTRNSPYPIPWHVAPTPASLSNPRATVIGAGLAGSHSARALAERGWKVTVLERGKSIASGASGNAQGIVYGKLSSDSDGLASYNLSSLLYAQRFYGSYWRQSPAFGEQCGLLQLAFNKKEEGIRQKLHASFAGADDFLRFVEPEHASEIAGLPIEVPCVYFPQLGWLNPALLCRELLHHPNIELQCNVSITALEYDETAGLWRLLDQAGHPITETPRVVIANAHHALDFPQTGHLPLKPIRGQVSEFPGEHIPLKTVLCGEGYIAPATARGSKGRLQSFGASYTLKEQRREVLPDDHRHNLAKLSGSLPRLATTIQDLDPGRLSGRTAFRCTTADYLPLVGPVPDYSRLIQTFQSLGRNAKANIPQSGTYLPGLYINVGHGSRGLAYTPLAGELLAAQMNGDPLPLTRDLATALNPARFIIRDLIRRRLKP